VPFVAKGLPFAPEGHQETKARGDQADKLCGGEENTVSWSEASLGRPVVKTSPGSNREMESTSRSLTYRHFGRARSGVQQTTPDDIATAINNQTESSTRECLPNDDQGARRALSTSRRMASAATRGSAKESSSPAKRHVSQTPANRI